jgi:hypothetical protein
VEKLWVVVIDTEAHKMRIIASTVIMVLHNYAAVSL